jgi:hypothetical protein
MYCCRCVDLLRYRWSSTSMAMRKALREYRWCVVWCLVPFVRYGRSIISIRAVEVEIELSRRKNRRGCIFCLFLEYLFLFAVFGGFCFGALPGRVVFVGIVAMAEFEVVAVVVVVVTAVLRTAVLVATIVPFSDQL